MGFLENIWFLLTFSIIIIILITDTKGVAASPGNSMSKLFSSSSKQQTFLTRLNWIFILLYFLLSLGLSYFIE